MNLEPCEQEEAEAANAACLAGQEERWLEEKAGRRREHQDASDFPDERMAEARETHHQPRTRGNKMKKERPVLVTTEFKGVFFGYLSGRAGETVSLKRARLCIYWNTDIRGFMGLAANGPNVQCRIGPAADIELRKVTSVVEVSDEAAKKWEDEVWK